MIKKSNKVVKGTSSAVLLSFLIHAGLFLLAGLFVVFTVIDKAEPEFVAPPAVDRPKMKLKKPQVKLKKTSRPKATAKIMTKVTRTTMPDIQLPEMSGVGDGIGGGLGDGFGVIPDLDVVTMFGSEVSIGNDLVGTFYDLKRYRDGRTSGISEVEGVQDAMRKFISSDWKQSVLSRYYSSPKKLYTSTIMVPPTESSLGPAAFGEREMESGCFMLHYKGQLVHKDGIKFRFVVMGDNYLLIRLKGKVVMDYKNQFNDVISGPPFKPLSYHLGHWYAFASDWIELEAGVPQDIEMIMGDYEGGLAAFMVAIEEYGVDYPSAPTPQDNPVLPIFKTATLSRDQIDAIYYQMWEGHLDLEGGPIFSDYDTGVQSTNTARASADLTVQAPADSKQPAPSQEKSTQRVWSLTNGKSIEAEYLRMSGGMVLLKTPDGKIHKLAPSELSTEDIDILAILNPPKLTIDFKRDEKGYTQESDPDAAPSSARSTEFTAGVVVKQEDRNKDYPRPLRLEFYVTATDYDGDDFTLLDRQIENFTLTPENGRRFELRGEKKFMLEFVDHGENKRGQKHHGHMILIFNERDELIAQNLSHDWLLGLRDKLQTFPVERRFDKSGERVYPPRPKFTDTYWTMPP